MSAREMRKAGIFFYLFFVNTYIFLPAHTNAQAHTSDTDTAAVQAITMIQMCPWETA